MGRRRFLMSRLLVRRLPWQSVAGAMIAHFSIRGSRRPQSLRQDDSSPFVTRHRTRRRTRRAAPGSAWPSGIPGPEPVIPGVRRATPIRPYRKNCRGEFDRTQKPPYPRAVARLTRYLAPQVRRDLARKMVFVAGPAPGRQDDARPEPARRRRPATSTGTSPSTASASCGASCRPAKLWVFDEIHKYRRWRNYLKGLYDGRPRGQRILVTGSARLDFYRFGGDSLQGRYHLLRLHPFSAAELGLTHARGAPGPARPRRLPGAVLRRLARSRRGAGRASTARCSCARRSRASSASRTSGTSSC